MIQQTPLAYVYIRWSSDKQNERESAKRQEKACLQFADTLGLTVKKMVDKGASAFSGSNRTKGELGGFLLRAQAGTIPKGSWLICENLDRLSRENPQEAQYWLLTILRAGISIHTTMDDHTYTPHERNASMHLMRALFSQDLAYEESQKKSNRTLSAAHNAILRNIAGEKLLACTAAGRPPWWIAREKRGRDYYNKLKPDCVPLIEKMIDLTFEGMGSERIAMYLNEHHLPRPKGLKGEWQSTFISKTLANVAIYGEANISLKETDAHAAKEYQIPDYYPQIVSKERFYKMRALKKKARTPLRNDPHVNLLGGMNIVRCGHCGGTMYHNRQNRGTKNRYMCTNGQQGKCCRAWTFTAEWLEDTVMRLCNNQIIQPQTNSTNQQEKERLEMLLADQKSAQSKLIDLSLKVDDDRIEILAEKLNTTQVAVKKLEEELQSIETKILEEQREAIDWGGIDPRVTDPEEHDLRRELRPRIAESIEKITCTQVKAGYIKFKILFKNQIEIQCERQRSVFRISMSEWLKLSGIDDSDQEAQDIFAAKHLNHMIDFGVTSNYKYAPEVIEIKATGSHGSTTTMKLYPH